MTVVVAPPHADPTTQFAAQELSRYLSRMLRVVVPVVVASRDVVAPAIQLEVVAGEPAAHAGQTPDDVITIEVQDGRGRITGSSSRSVLLGVYRFLFANGCRWVRPGDSGEIVPSITAIADVARFESRPALRHRILCVEGAFSYQHLRSMIDWAPKAGFNGFFMQFRDAYTFFDRWYSDPRRRASRGRLPRGTAAALARRAEAEIRRRGLVLHTVGHGWGCESIGIAGLGWDYPPPPIPDSVKPLLALVDGERRLFGGVPINTNLCYSNPEVHRRFVNEVVDYAERHGDVDIIQVWLADNANNHCECPDCIDIRPADAYLKLLNDVSDAMTDQGMLQRIVCIAYQDLLWPPISEHVRDPGRFLFAFAPVSRSYARPFHPDADAGVAMRPFHRNDIELPRTADEHAPYLTEWRRRLPTESFMFDYHLWRNQYTDPGSLQTARVLWNDLKALKAMGFQGFASCQPVRSTFPTGLAMSVLADTLWDDGLDFDDIVASSLESAFGPEWQTAYEYLGAVSDRIDPAYLRGESVDLAAVHPAAAELLDISTAGVRSFGVMAGTASHPVHRRSWELLAHHAWLVGRIVEIVILRRTGRVDAGVAAFRDLEAELDATSDGFDDALDDWMLKTSLADAMASSTEPPAPWI